MNDTFGALKKLHRQPKEVRQHIGFFIAGLVTVIIFIFWLMTLDTRFGSTDHGESETHNTVVTPFETVSQSFYVMITSVREQFGELSEE